MRNLKETANRLASLALLALLTPADAGTNVNKAPVNLGLEDGETGKVPTGWRQPKYSIDAGYKVELTEEKPKAGKRCVLISRDAKQLAQGVGRIDQAVDATSFQGKRIRLRASVRADVPAFLSSAGLFFRVDRKGNQDGFFDNMADRPIVENAWREYEIFGDVANDAETINFGLLLFGNGKTWLDAVSIDIIGKVGDGNEAARPLKGRGLDNLVAFSKLLGYVRYFHPSDQAAATKWDAFAIEGVARVEPAKDAAELAQTLETLFRPIAPTVRVFLKDKTPPPVVKEESAKKFVAWHHFGVGVGNPGSIYSSMRVNSKEPIPTGPGIKLPDVKLPDPTKPLVTELGGGVSCSVPLAVYADDATTLPIPAAKSPPAIKPYGFIPSGNDRSTRLAGVVLSWNVFQHFYPYFDVVKTDWPGELRRALAKAATDSDERAYPDTLRRLVAGLDDGHGLVTMTDPPRTFYPPLGWEWIEDRVVVTRVAAAGADGVKPGDEVVKVNGRPVAEVLAEHEQLISASTLHFKRFQGLFKLAEGAKDSEITLGIITAAGKAETIRLRRTSDYRTFAGMKELRPAKVEALKPGIMYLDIDRITDKDFEEVMPQLEKAKGIIFDLRGYPNQVSTELLGHLSDKPATFPRMEIPVTLYPDHKDVAYFSVKQQFEPKKPRLSAKVAFLSDTRAGSQSESCLAIIAHHKLGAIVGTASGGYNGDINPFRLPGGYQVYWTGLKVTNHDGSPHHGVGILPTVPVSRTMRGVAEGRDEILERAIKVVTP